MALRPLTVREKLKQTCKARRALTARVEDEVWYRLLIVVSISLNVSCRSIEFESPTKHECGVVLFSADNDADQ